jgi:hypothetical protein
MSGLHGCHAAALKEKQGPVSGFNWNLRGEGRVSG